MDPMSIAAGMVKITATCTTLLQAIGRYIVETKTASVAVCEFHGMIRTLDYSIVEISKLLHQRGPEVLPFERKHHEHIQSIVNSCACTLERLETKLDDGQWRQGETDDFSTARIDFDLALGSKMIRQLTSLIKSYNIVLQLSMITLSLTVTWAAEGSQGEIKEMIRQLADSIPQLHPKRPSVQPNSPFLIDMNDGVTEFNMSIPHEIRAWRLSAENVAAAVSLYDPDQMSQFDFDSAICEYSNDCLWEEIPSDSGVDLVFDQEHESNSSVKASESRYGNDDYVCPHLLQSQFEKARKTVTHLVSCGLFIEASRFQRKCIDYKMSLANLGELPTPRAELADMQEDLAEILLKTGTRDGEAGAIDTLEKLLADEDSEPTEILDHHRRCRLYHRLGSIYMLSSPSEHDQAERLKLARGFLMRAFNGRREMEPMPRDLVLESGDLLVRVMHLDRDFESARSYMEWMRKELRPDLSNPGSYKQQRQRLRSQAQSSVGAVAEVRADEEDGEELVNAYMWSQSRGFDIDAGDFDFATCSASRGTSPLHMAVFEEKLGIIKPMLACASSLEHRDSNHLTPLLLACHTRNCKVVDILLENEACFIDAGGSVVSDCRGKSALHLCQVKKGGVRVAKLLVRYAQRLVCPLPLKELATTVGSRADVQLLQAVDHAGKSALFTAVENGNEEMVQFLLEAGACPNLLDNLGKTALYVACERGDERVVRQLLSPKNGSADPNAPGPGLCTPLMAALEHGPSIAVKMALARMLLEAGADPNRADGDGRTALMVAKQSSFSSQLVRLMQDAAAMVSRVEPSLRPKSNSCGEKVSKDRLAWTRYRQQGKSRTSVG
ncbi:hypothetical protein MCOR25_003239 [Pyricularia grisea]|nr:hypothetical protein MCOR25_003239 [Pyricularia grisea]